MLYSKYFLRKLDGKKNTEVKKNISTQLRKTFLKLIYKKVFFNNKKIFILKPQ